MLSQERRNKSITSILTGASNVVPVMKPVNLKRFRSNKEDLLVSGQIELTTETQRLWRLESYHWAGVAAQ